MNIENTKKIIEEIEPGVTLVAVTKNQLIDEVAKLYEIGVNNFGENKLQELIKKKEVFPDANWHFIGRIQRNKLRAIVKNSTLIHSVSELRYLQIINEEAAKIGKIQEVLLQLNLAGEDTKKGISQEHFDYIINNQSSYPNVLIRGLMVMGDHVDDQAIIAKTFNQANDLFIKLSVANPNFNILSMGMSSDYNIAISCGSNMVRIGTLLFKD